MRNAQGHRGKENKSHQTEEASYGCTQHHVKGQPDSTEETLTMLSGACLLDCGVLCESHEGQSCTHSHSAAQHYKLPFHLLTSDAGAHTWPKERKGRNLSA